MSQPMDSEQVLMVVVGVASSAAVLFVLVLRSLRRTVDAFSAEPRVAALAQALGGAAAGPMQWLAPHGQRQAGVIVETASSRGISRVSVWLSRRPSAPPRLVLRLFYEYDEPLRRAFDAGELTRIVVRPRSRLFGWVGPSALASSALGELSAELRVVSTTADEIVRACLAQPEIRQHLRGALAVGFDELILYPPDGVELVAHTPHPSVLDPGTVHAALAWLEPMAEALDRLFRR